MYCKPKVNNGSVVIYYGTKGVMRFPTGVKISKSKDRSKKFIQWDYKNNRVSIDVPNSTDMNKIISDWLVKADNIVSEYLKDGATITADELKSNLDRLKDGKAQVKTSLFLDHYDEYMERKRVQLVERGNKSNESYKTYGTFRSTIEDYEAEHQTTLKNSDVTNNDWLNHFHSWLTIKRKKQIIHDGVIYKFKTKGNLKPASVDKRFEVLTGYFTYLKEKELIKDDNFLKRYKRNEITVTSKIKTTLSINEIHELYNYKFDNDVKENVKLIFIFSCLTGFRWKDIENFDKGFICDFKESKVYKHVAQKTKGKIGKIATIPLSKMAIEILETLNYNLKIYSNAYTNQVLHKLLKESKLFDQLTLAEDETGKNLKRYELLTMHRGRDTFITNLINTVPLHELMSYTSHEKLSTLQKYIDYSRDINPEYVSIFDEKPAN
ncbi:tyrosine-type recombinase/integrase [Bizionia sp. M204]|uniref:tyrosine-type recombinase/integrase n=1 Tax=Bizionia sp. M204 TaxID=2675331 RepID=UPI0020612B23|nr:tyrosine-type recombinase/integrase [Bizionia sp. M204]UPS90290.1 tyrosine-type recombinase/integrase [Bizionia sp. M204]